MTPHPAAAFPASFARRNIPGFPSAGQGIAAEARFGICPKPA